MDYVQMQHMFVTEALTDRVINRKFNKRESKRVAARWVNKAHSCTQLSSYRPLSAFLAYINLNTGLWSRCGSQSSTLYACDLRCLPLLYTLLPHITKLKLCSLQNPMVEQFSSIGRNLSPLNQTTIFL